MRNGNNFRGTKAAAKEPWPKKTASLRPQRTVATPIAAETKPKTNDIQNNISDSASQISL